MSCHFSLRLMNNVSTKNTNLAPFKNLILKICNAPSKNFTPDDYHDVIEHRTMCVILLKNCMLLFYFLMILVSRTYIM